MNDAVEVCAICDIAGCYHIRERNAPADPLSDERVRKLVEALQPFAACADELDAETASGGREWPDDEWAKFRLLVSDYRKARAALAAIEAQP